MSTAAADSARTTALPASRSTAPQEAKPATNDQIAAEENNQFAVGLVGAGLVLLVVFQLSYLCADYRLEQAQSPYLLAFNAFNLCVVLAVGALLWTSRFRRNWRAVFFSASVALIGGTTGIALITGSPDELGFLVLGLVSAAGFLMPWGCRWQASMSLSGMGAMLVADVWCPSSKIPAAVRWLMLLASAGVGWLVTYQRERYRHRLRDQLEVLIRTEQKLRAEIVEREMAENRVKEREALLQEIFDASPDVITVMSLKDGKFSYMNRQLGLSGYSKEELLGRPIAELGIWADAGKLDGMFAQLRSGQVVRNLEFSLRRKDGALLPCVVSATPAQLGGQPSVIAVVRDISAFKRAQEANAFWAAVSNSSDVAITSAAPDFVYNGWNPAAERLYGYSAQEALGKDISFILAPGLQRFANHVTGALRRGQTIRDLEQQCLRKDGRQIVCSFTISPVYNEAGELVGYSALSYDVTARKQAEQRLAEREAKFRDIFNLNPDPVSVNLLKDGIYLDINERWLELFGFAREEVIGRTPLELGIWKNIDDLRAVHRRLLAQRRLINYEAIFRVKNGRQFVALFSAVVTELNGREVILSFVRDISERKIAEQKLAESEAKLRQFFEASPDVIVIASLGDGRILEINPAFVAQSGFSREEVLGATGLDLNLWIDAAQRQVFYAELERAGLVKNIELTFRAKDGRVVPTLFSAVKGLLQGEPCVFTIARDITELKRAESELRASEEKFKGVFDSSLDAIVVADVETGEVVDANREWLRRTGHSALEVIGKTIEELGIWVSQEHYAKFRESLQKFGYVKDFEVPFRNANGELGLRLLSTSKIKIGDRWFRVSVTKDISQLKKVEAELRASEEKFRQVFDSALDAIVVAGLKDGIIIDANAELTRRLGVSREKVIGKTSLELGVWARESDYAAFRETMRRLGYVRNQEALIRNHDGTLGVRLLNSSKVKIGGRWCAVTVSRDISALKEIERQLIETREAALAASKAKSEFLSIMSHEIRTPMNAIIGAGDVLSGSPLNTEQRKYLEMMLSNANALLALINNILDLARVESGHMQIEHGDFELDQVVEETARDMALRAHKKGLELVARIAGDVPLSLTGDSLRLRQMLVNLLGNAIKFTTRGQIVLTVKTADDRCASTPSTPKRAAANGFGAAAEASAQAGAPCAIKAPGPASRKRASAAGATVQASLQAMGTAAPNETGWQVWLHFAVADSGIGIPQDKLEAIFTEFTQLDSSTTRKNGGTGLGLTIVRRLAELNGGRVWVESTLGAGSTFRLTLPFQARLQAPAARACENLDFAGARVLVVDDSSATRLAVKEILCAAGARVEEARLGSEALTMVERAEVEGDPFQVLLLDGQMPGMDGFEVAQGLADKARHAAERSPAVVMMLTSDGLGAQLARVSQSHAASYLVKPPRRAELRAAVGAALKLKPHTSGQTAPASGPSAVARADPKMPERILLVEDSADNRAIVKAYLAHTPYKLDTADNGEQAVEKFIAAAGAGNKYDLVLMDVQMPVMDGHAATRMIRQWERDRKLERTPIVALTASAFAHDVRQSLDAGCDAHVSKPVRQAALLEAIGRACTHSQAAAGKTGTGAPAAGEFDNAGSTIVVQVEPALASLAPGFLKRKRQDLLRMQRALEQEDYDTVRGLAHIMKGEGGALGFDPISEIGARLETAAQAGDVDAMRRCIAALSDYLANVRVLGAAVE